MTVKELPQIIGNMELTTIANFLEQILWVGAGLVGLIILIYVISGVAGILWFRRQ